MAWWWKKRAPQGCAYARVIGSHAWPSFYGPRGTFLEGYPMCVVACQECGVWRLLCTHTDCRSGFVGYVDKEIDE